MPVSRWAGLAMKRLPSLPPESERPEADRNGRRGGDGTEDKPDNADRPLTLQV
jgi:hypothetical protein